MVSQSRSASASTYASASGSAAPSTYTPTLMLAVARRDPSRGALEEALRDELRRDCLGSDHAAAAGVRTFLHAVGFVLDLLKPPALIAGLNWVAEDGSVVCSVWASPPSNPRLAVAHGLRRARESPHGFVAPRHRTDPVAALLGLHMAVLRAGTPAQW